MSLVDLTGVTADLGFDVVPVGEYKLQVEDAIVKPTSKGTGTLISVTLTIKGGDYDNRKVFSRYNISNPNPKAVEIGLKQLKALMESAGNNNSTINQVGDLYGLTFVAKVGIEKNPERGESNVIKAYIPYAQGAGLVMSGSHPHLSKGVSSPPSFSTSDVPF